jgi:hypothetical protein
MWARASTLVLCAQPYAFQPEDSSRSGQVWTTVLHVIRIPMLAGSRDLVRVHNMRRIFPVADSFLYNLLQLAIRGFIAASIPGSFLLEGW